MRSLTVLMDLDGIIVNLLEPWLKWYNKLYGDVLTIEGIRSPEVEKYVLPVAKEHIYDFINRDGIFETLPPMAGAIDFVQRVEDGGHKVYFVTSFSRNAISAANKIRWMQSFLNVRKSQIILTSAKYLVKGDVFIDDTPNMLKNYREHNPDAHLFTIAYPYNKGVEDYGVKRYESYVNSINAFSEMHRDIRVLAGP